PSALLDAFLLNHPGFGRPRLSSTMNGVETPDTVEFSPAAADRAPIHAGAGKHDFVPSEFRPELGRCDICGGGPRAEIHQAPVDHLARIAEHMERLSCFVEVGAERWVQRDPAAVALERIADALERPYRVGDSFK